MSSRPVLLATLDGYANEGGFDTPHGLATCYAPAIGLGRLESPGRANDLWGHYDIVPDLVHACGLDGVRVVVEWARIEPRPGRVDSNAVATYREALSLLRNEGLYLSVCLIDAVWPSWLGQEAWLLPWAHEAFIAHAQRTSEAFGDLADSFVPFARPDLVEAGFQRGTIPPWRTRARADAADATTQLAATTARLNDLPGLRDKQKQWREIPAVVPDAAVTALVGEISRFDEIHMRSLLPGYGPTAPASSLCAYEDSALIARAVSTALAEALGR